MLAAEDAKQTQVEERSLLEKMVAVIWVIMVQ